MKSKILPTIKSVFILALAVLAVFQVSQLWLVNLTNRNFFMYLQARFPPAVPDGQSAFARPFRIISGAGDGLFEIRYSAIADSQEWVFGETALYAVLRSGEFAGETNMSQVLAQPIFIYEYAFNMCAEIFAQAFGRRNGDLLTDEGIEAFTSVAVLPPCAEEQMLRVFFIDEPRVWEFTLQLDSRRYLAEDFEIPITHVNPELKHFISTEGGFIPRTPRGGFAYYSVIVENPFRDPHGLFRISHVLAQIQPFFDNPATIIPSVSGVDNVFTFSNRKTMVRFLKNSVLEYTSYRTIGRTAPINFMSDFSVALAFVTDDPHVNENEIFLSHHDTCGRAHVFWFDYVIDNHPLVLMEEWYTGINCTDPLLAPIEVVVDHGRVVRYRRLAYAFRVGRLTWKGLPTVETDKFFSLGFPIGSGPEIELAILTEVQNGMGTR